MRILDSKPNPIRASPSLNPIRGPSPSLNPIRGPSLNPDMTIRRTLALHILDPGLDPSPGPILAPGPDPSLDPNDYITSTYNLNPVHNANPNPNLDLSPNRDPSCLRSVRAHPRHSPVLTLLAHGTPLLGPGRGSHCIGCGARGTIIIITIAFRGLESVVQQSVPIREIEHLHVDAEALTCICTSMVQLRCSPTSTHVTH